MSERQKLTMSFIVYDDQKMGEISTKGEMIELAKGEKHLRICVGSKVRNMRITKLEVAPDGGIRYTLKEDEE